MNGENNNEQNQNMAHAANKGSSINFNNTYNKNNITDDDHNLKQIIDKNKRQIPFSNHIENPKDSENDLENDPSNDSSYESESNEPIEGYSSTDISEESEENDTSNDNTTSLNNEDFGLNLLSSSTKKRKKLKFVLIPVAVLILILPLLMISSIMLPIEIASNFVKGVWNGVVDFFTTDNQELEEAFYQELKDVQQEFNRKYNVCIDTNLIAATLLVNTDYEDFLETGEEFDESGETDDNNIPYKKMKKQVRKLARMQLITNRYLLDNTGTSYCKTNSKTELITTGNKNSSTIELIASHDMDGIEALFTSKINEEQNNRYYYFYPQFASDGTCTKKYANEQLPKTSWELSIGDFNTMEESVYYFNLINTFVPEYYKDILPDKSHETYQEKVLEIVEDIYMLYKEAGTNQSCNIFFAGPSNLAPNGITIDGVGTFDLEEYVAGVVSREAYTSEGMEALKAQAVAARTYVLKYTEYGKKSIPNSTNAQTFTRIISDRAREAAMATRGEILVDSNGNIFSSNYDSFCYDDKDCPDSTRNSDGTYSVTYTKVPNGEKHKITLTDPKQYNRITHGQGHAHGMSQLLSYEMAKNGSDYKEILYYFYSDGVEITKASSGNGSSLAVANGSASDKLNYLFPVGLPVSHSEASTYMTTVSFPVVDINGNRSIKSATLHQKLADDFVNIMTEIADSGFPIKDVGCYNFRGMNGSNSRSHHSYGVACDLNVNENYMIKDGKILAGSYWRPGDDPYSFTENGVVVNTFSKYGWGWGGSWSSHKDYMHFSFTGH